VIQTKQGLIDVAGPKLRSLVSKIDTKLRALGCLDYVKTIYIGYEIDGVMVAAVYPHPDHIEVALAVEESLSHELLGPADHLSWRTLPLSAVLTKVSEFSELIPILENAAARIGGGIHAVNRDNDYFKKRRGANRGRSVSGKSPRAKTTKYVAKKKKKTS